MLQRKENQQNKMPTPLMPNPMEEPQKSLEPSKSFNLKLDKNSIFAGLAILAVIVTLVLIFINFGSGNIPSFIFNSSKEKITKEAIDYLNQSVLQPGQVATLGDITEESGVIKFQVNIGGNSYESYVTKDGKLFFPKAYSLTGQTSQENQQAGQVGFNQIKTEGEPFIGKDDAPAVMVYWFDYQCPFCKRHEQTVMKELIKEYVNSGKLKIVFKDYQFLGPDSITAGLAASAVWEIASNKFFEWHKAMFEKQDDENSGWGKKLDILALTKSLGIDSLKVDQLMTQKASEYQKEMDEDKAEGTGFGIDGTPGTIIGKQLISGAQSYDSFKSAIEEELK